MGRARRAAAVHTGLRTALEDAFLDAIAQRGDAQSIGGQRPARELRRLAQTHIARDVLCPRAVAALMLPAKKKRLEPRALANVKCPDAPSGIELVSRNRGQVQAQ